MQLWHVKNWTTVKQMNKEYYLDTGCDEIAKLQIDNTNFIISYGEGIDERTLYFEIYQNSNTDVVSIVGIEYGRNREFLNKISEEFNELISRESEQRFTIRLDDGEKICDNRWKEYCNVGLWKVVEDGINQLKIYINIPFKMNTQITINNAATPEILTKLSETFAELAEKETDYLVPNFEKWSY